MKFKNVFIYLYRIQFIDSQVYKYYSSAYFHEFAIK